MLLETLLAALPLALAPSPDAPAALQGPLPAGAQDRYLELAEDYEDAALAWRRAKRAALRAREAFREPHPVEEYYPRFLALAEGGDGRALLWAGLHVQETARTPGEVKQAKRDLVGRVARDFAAAPWIVDLVKVARAQEEWLTFAEIDGHLARIQGLNADREVRALAGFTRAQAFELRAGEGDLDRAEELYRDVLRNFAGTKTAGKAERRLPALEVRVGKPAPDLPMEDVDGTPFRLSEYRGRVVVLDFYGFW